jgi:hypothetical protein
VSWRSYDSYEKVKQAALLPKSRNTGFVRAILFGDEQWKHGPWSMEKDFTSAPRSGCDSLPVRTGTPKKCFPTC